MHGGENMNGIVEYSECNNSGKERQKLGLWDVLVLY